MTVYDASLSPELSRFLVISDWEWSQAQQARAQKAAAEFEAHQQHGAAERPTATASC